MGLKGPALSPAEKGFIISNRVAGVILFKRNIRSFQQTYELCSELKSLTQPPLLIAIDMEGGEVNRFSHIQPSIPWPSPQALQALEPESIFLIARAMARQISLLGIDINFAPVADLPIVKSPLLKTRVFGRSKDEILRRAEPFVKGLIKGGVLPCVKHFPGHGGVRLDSHKTLPKDKRQLKDLEEQLDIFQTLFKNRPCWVMTAHIEFPYIDQKPATFSEFFLKTLLREQRGFKEVVASDDIDMSALKKWPAGERFFRAIQGGCHLVIAGQKAESPAEIIKYFKGHPKKEREIRKDGQASSKKILKIRRKTAYKPWPSFKNVEKELLRSRPVKLLSSLGLM